MFFGQLRLLFARLLIGKRAVIANVNIQFMEANSLDRKATTFINCTRGTIFGKCGLIAIGSYALADLFGLENEVQAKPFSAPVPLFEPWQDHETRSLQPSAYEAKGEVTAITIN